MPNFRKQPPKPKSIFSSNRWGFTLVELLVTVVVLTIGCLAAIRLQATSLKSSNLADHIMVATFLAEGEMERLKALTFPQLTVEAAKGQMVEAGLNRLGQPCRAELCSGHIFTRTVNYYQAIPTSLSYQVEIIIDWTDNTGPQRVLHSAAITSLSF
ncbi:MAG: prepilin-type N-terminal cleavage/methylation domain-containing protein [Deltaproteobacteria bacterium]|jgi:prepilin-type N-terminal cleavage/methylation domain-containing protein|nr:prepilin-type N-terminal cleavage/methylation domain-containing protein [Deltaproteobacteria bacterium]